MWGATKSLSNFCRVSSISIHAPRVGSDGQKQGYKSRIYQFQSTLPVWGATLITHRHQSSKSISIHAPRVGSDRVRANGHSINPDFNPRSPCGERLCILRPPRYSGCYFNPRSPCGERLLFRTALPGNTGFQSTLPVWGATLASV